MSVITLQMPKSIFSRIQIKTPTQTFEELVTVGQILLIDLLAFSYLNTRIFDTETDKTFGYVSVWENGNTSITKSAGDYQHLIGMENFTIPHKESSKFFEKYWNENCKI